MMKFLPLLALLGSMSSVGHAFTLDAVGYEGADLVREPMSLRLAGYGEVVFESGLGDVLVVDSGYESVASLDGVPLVFNKQDAVKVTVNGQAGDSGHEPRLVTDATAAGQETAGRDSIWPVIPEPASAGFGLIGLLLLLMGRRR